MMKGKIPAGLRDKLFREATGLYELEKLFSELTAKRGFQKIETPTIEYDSLFEQSKTARYQFFDKQNELLTLRSDLTTPIGRVIAMTNLALPLKLSYAGKVFRANEEMRGEQNEFTQVGVELIGFPANFKAEIECLQTAHLLLESMNLTHYHFELGHAAFFKELCQIVTSGRLSEEEKESIQNEFTTLLLGKNISGLERFVAKYPGDYSELIRQLPYLYGTANEVLHKAREILSPIATSPNILFVLEELENLLFLLSETLENVTLTIDLGLVPQMNYYTGVLFNAYADGMSESFLRGGRYNELIPNRTDSISAVGFAIHLDAIVSLKYQNNTLAKLLPPSILIHFEENPSDIRLAQRLLCETENTQLSLFSEKVDALAFAKKWQLDEVWSVSNGQVEKREVTP